ncbi:MAG: hypothetical protein KDJ47_14465 [Hyphomicrobiaceae bacterium]|nr:hypothetical protein [Hyphomicrobiaceae bacterium]
MHILKGAVLGAAAVAVLSAGLSMGSDPAAAARKVCLYKAYNPFSKIYDLTVEGYATSAKQSWACNRAKDECLKRLRHRWKIGLNSQYRCERTR